MTGLDLLAPPDFFGRPLAVVLIDLLLAGDNALVIALVCLAVPPGRLRLVLALGTVGAIVLRIILALMAGGLLMLPGLKLAGGVLLGVLALNLSRPGTRRFAVARPHAIGGVLPAVALVAVVDVLMSLDNVLALTAVAGDSPPMLALGLAFSVSILMFGSAAVAGLLRRHPELARLGVAMLGWIAGRMVLADDLVAPWAGVQAPALPLVVPALAAAYVYLLGARDAAVLAGHEVAIAVPACAAPVHRPPRRRPPPARPRRLPPEPPASPAETPVDVPSASRGDVVIMLAMFAAAGILLALALVFGGGASQ